MLNNSDYEEGFCVDVDDSRGDSVRRRFLGFRSLGRRWRGRFRWAFAGDDRASFNVDRPSTRC